jgi:uncharacterized LabA/DUF88 family protein
MNKKTGTNYAFIDSQNLYLGVIKSGWELDYQKFRNYLRTKYKVSKAYLFIGYVPTNTNLYRSLQEAGFILIFKPVLEIRQAKKTTYKGNVDAELVLHTMIEFPNYDRAIIVSGDGDFRCLVEHLDSENKLFKVLVPNYKYSSLLKDFAKYIVPLGLLEKKLGK